MQICKLANYRILFLILFPLWGVGGYAQPYEWDWAINGGSNNLDDDYWRYSTEQVYDVVVGSDNNYYFLARIKGSSLGLDSKLAGQPVKEYNGSVGNNGDIFLFSTTCDGQVRWSQAIGGYQDDKAYNLALDSKNNVYIGATVTLGFHAYAKPQYF